MPGTDRLVRNGQVAVLISPGFGSGWSTWSHEYGQDMLFDPQIADIMLNESLSREERLSQVRTVAELKYPDDCLLGLDDLQVVMIKQGMRFVVNEHDGSESITLEEQVKWIVA